MGLTKQILIRKDTQVSLKMILLISMLSFFQIGEPRSGGGGSHGLSIEGGTLELT